MTPAGGFAALVGLFPTYARNENKIRILVGAGTNPLDRQTHRRVARSHRPREIASLCLASSVSFSHRFSGRSCLGTLVTSSETTRFSVGAAPNVHQCRAEQLDGFTGWQLASAERASNWIVCRRYALDTETVSGSADRGVHANTRRGGAVRGFIHMQVTE